MGEKNRYLSQEISGRGGGPEIAVRNIGDLQKNGMGILELVPNMIYKACW